MGRASQCTEDAAAATMVTAIAVMGFALRRARRKSAVKVKLKSRTLSMTTPRNPHTPLNPAKMTSESHSRRTRRRPVWRRKTNREWEPDGWKQSIRRANVPSRIAIAEQGLDAFHAPEKKYDGHEEGEVRH